MIQVLGSVPGRGKTVGVRYFVAERERSCRSAHVSVGLGP